MIFKAKKKPVVVEVIEFTGWNWREVYAFMGEEDLGFLPNTYKESFFIETPEGVMQVDIGDYIIRGVAGEFYPCKPDIFNRTFEIEKDGWGRLGINEDNADFQQVR